MFQQPSHGVFVAVKGSKYPCNHGSRGYAVCPLTPQSERWLAAPILHSEAIGPEFNVMFKYYFENWDSEFKSFRGPNEKKKNQTNKT